MGDFGEDPDVWGTPKADSDVKGALMGSLI